MNFRIFTAFLLLVFYCLPAFADYQNKLILSIYTTESLYGLEHASAGELSIFARFENAGGSELFVAHPSACVPEGYDGRGVFYAEERRGMSELLVYITRPGGGELVLRSNMLRGFEPGNRFHLVIPPGGYQEVRLGWFGPYYALGMWDDLREPIFTERGEYRIRMVYRNFFKKALKFGGGEMFEKETPWTGVLESNTISVRVE